MGTVDALLVGRPVPARVSEGARLEFLGAVGSGWNRRNSRYLFAQLAALAQPTRPFSTPVPAEYARYAIWVRAQIFGEVEYRSWTVSGTLREPSWTRVLAGKALRDL